MPRRKNINPQAVANLKALIDEKGLSLQKFADSLERRGYSTSPQNVHRYVTGENEMPTTFAREVERVYGVNASWLLGLNPYKTPEAYRRHLEAKLLGEGGQALSFAVATIGEAFGCTLNSTDNLSQRHYVPADNDITGFTLDGDARYALWFELTAQLAGWSIECWAANVTAPAQGADNDGALCDPLPYVVLLRGEERIALDKASFDALVSRLLEQFGIDCRSFARLIGNQGTCATSIERG